MAKDTGKQVYWKHLKKHLKGQHKMSVATRGKSCTVGNDLANSIFLLMKKVRSTYCSNLLWDKLLIVLSVQNYFLWRSSCHH